MDDMLGTGLPVKTLCPVISCDEVTKTGAPVGSRSVCRTLRLKVKSEAYRWLDAAAVEVNQVFNYCNQSA
jgi:hypothetical protein